MTKSQHAHSRQTRSWPMPSIMACLLLVGTIAAQGQAQPDTSNTAKRAPNIILIMADDMGYECVSAYGSSTYHTPNLDRLAKSGVRFNHCYAQPICTPSRVKIMTGKYNFRNYEKFGLLPPGEVTFANILKEAGYATAVIGKWQLGGDAQTVKDFGFDEHALWYIQGRESRFWQPRIYENGRVREDIRERYGPDVLTDFALNFIDRNQDQPFFLYYPMLLTHYPYVPTPDSDFTGSRDRVGEYDGMKGGEEYFDDMVAYTDKIVGQIVHKLDVLGLRENTLILFTGDNGNTPNIISHIGETIVQGGKGWMTDAGTRVALIANWPGRLRGGQVIDTLVDFSDFLPTIAAAANAPLPEGLAIDGRSFLPQMLGQRIAGRPWIIIDYRRNGTPERPEDGQKAEQLRERQLAQRQAKRMGRFVRDRRYKLYADGRFYDVQSDVLEENDIPKGTGSSDAEAARETLATVHAGLPAWRTFRDEGE